jgi:UDP-glucuronate decarboxylase
VQALSGEPITLYGDGNQTRSFCYVSDLIDGLIRLMETPAEVTGPINIGNPAEFTMRELAELVLAETGLSLPLVNKPLPQDDPKQRRPNIGMAQKHLGWEPKVPLREGLKPTVAYFRELLKSMKQAAN